MPKQVNHDQRRSDIIEALFDLVSREGLRAATFRNVAAEASVSVRRIQYYFDNKAGLMAAAVQALGERSFNRGLRAIDELGPEPTIRQVLTALTRSALPREEESRKTAVLFFSFFTAAIADAEIDSEEARRVKQWTVPFVAHLFSQAQAEGGMREQLNPHMEAIILMSVFDGLVLDALAGNLTVEDALGAFDYHLDRILTGKEVTARMPSTGHG